MNTFRPEQKKWIATLGMCSTMLPVDINKTLVNPNRIKGVYMHIEVCTTAGLLDYHPINTTDAKGFESFFHFSDPGICLLFIKSPPWRCLVDVVFLCNHVHTTNNQSTCFRKDVLHNRWLFLFCHKVCVMRDFNWYDTATGIRYLTSLNS